MIAEAQKTAETTVKNTVAQANVQMNQAVANGGEDRRQVSFLRETETKPPGFRRAAFSYFAQLLGR